MPALELRLGFELTPALPLLDEDPHRYVLEGTDCVLMEVPFAGPVDVLFALAEHVESAGLASGDRASRAHGSGARRSVIAEELAARGWTLQVNATSLLGRHGPEPEELGWSAGRRGRSLASSRPTATARRVRRISTTRMRSREQRLGAAAVPLFDGSALGLASTPSRTASRAASQAPERLELDLSAHARA